MFASPIVVYLFSFIASLVLSLSSLTEDIGHQLILFWEIKPTFQRQHFLEVQFNIEIKIIINHICNEPESAFER